MIRFKRHPGGATRPTRKMPTKAAADLDTIRRCTANLPAHHSRPLRHRQLQVAVEFLVKSRSPPPWRHPRPANPRKWSGRLLSCYAYERDTRRPVWGVPRGTPSTRAGIHRASLDTEGDPTMTKLRTWTVTAGIALGMALPATTFAAEEATEDGAAAGSEVPEATDAPKADAAEGEAKREGEAAKQATRGRERTNSSTSPSPPTPCRSRSPGSPPTWSTCSPGTTA
jgi:hypothetical protein